MSSLNSQKKGPGRPIEFLPPPNKNDFKTKQFLESCYEDQPYISDKENAICLITYVVERIFNVSGMLAGSGRTSWRKERRHA